MRHLKKALYRRLSDTKFLQTIVKLTLLNKECFYHFLIFYDKTQTIMFKMHLEIFLFSLCAEESLLFIL